MDDVADLNAAWAIIPPVHISAHRLAVGFGASDSSSSSVAADRPSTKEEIDAFMAEVNRSPHG